jgi:hypothetical protein
MRTKGSLRHVSISQDPVMASEQNSENARDANEAIDQCVRGFSRTFEHVAGAAGTTIPLRAQRQPQAVLCIRVQKVSEGGAMVMAWPYLGFAWDGRTSTADVQQPEGLTAGERYLLTYLVLE